MECEHEHFLPATIHRKSMIPDVIVTKAAANWIKMCDDEGKLTIAIVTIDIALYIREPTPRYQL